MTGHDDPLPRGRLPARAALSPREALSLPATRSPLRAAITAAYRRPEPEAVPPLVAAARLPAPTAAAAQALARGIIARAEIGTLAELARGQRESGRPSGQRTVFKSVGSALEDLAAAMLVHGVDPPPQSST